MWILGFGKLWVEIGKNSFRIRFLKFFFFVEVLGFCGGFYRDFRFILCFLCRDDFKG